MLSIIVPFLSLLTNFNVVKSFFLDFKHLCHMCYPHQAPHLLVSNSPLAVSAGLELKSTGSVALRPYIKVNGDSLVESYLETR